MSAVVVVSGQRVSRFEVEMTRAYMCASHLPVVRVRSPSRSLPKEEKHLPSPR
jgi:hypothetical protein